MALVVDHVTKRFGALTALDRVTFEVSPGTVFGFLGPNGAGKTTTMRIVLGILHPDAGRVLWRDRPTATLPRRTWGYLPEERGLYGRMRVLEQLVLFGRLYGMAASEAERIALGWLERFRIAEHARRRADELSKGNQQKVQFVAAVLHDPDVLLLDEPFSGLDPVNTGLLRDAFLELRDRGKTLVFSTHQMGAVEMLADAIAIVDRGRVIAGGQIAEVKRASGRQVVRVAVEGPGATAWVATLNGVRATRTGGEALEVAIPLTGDPQVLLAGAVAHGARVSRYEITEPTLEELFIQIVGRPIDDEERHLAAATESAASGATPEAAS